MASAVLKNEKSLTGPLTGKPSLNQSIYNLAKTVREPDRRISDAMDAMNLDEPLPEYPGQELAAYILVCYRGAKAHRDKVCASFDIMDSMRLREGWYSQHEMSLLGGENTAVWFPLTDRLCRTMTAFLRNIMTRDDENPNWKLTPTPIPEVPQFLADQAADIILRQLEQQINAGLPVDEDAFIEELSRVSDALLEEIRDEAAAAVERVSDVIRDHLEDADWRATFDDLLDDLVTFPAAFVKGPYITTMRRARYNEDKLKVEETRRIGIRTANPENMFPSADSTTTQDGTFMIEISQMSRRQIEESAHLEGFIAKNIEVVLAEFACEDRDWVKRCDQGMNRLRGLENPGSMWVHGDRIDVLEYHGSLSGKELLKLGVDHFDGRDIDPTIYYECEVFVVDDIVIRAVENIDPEHRRPYHKISLFPKPGAFWGKGIPMAIRDLQRVANAIWRSMVRNLGFASAPVTETDWALWDMDISKPPKNIVPGMNLDKNSDNAGHNGDLLKVHQIHSRGGEFLNMLNQVIEYAEITAGLPKFLQGDPSGTGGAARTLGGLATLQGNAAIGLKSAVVDIDFDLLEPLIEMIYDWIQCTTEDDSLKADAQVTVRGATHLLAREANKDRILQYIGALFPFVQAGLIEPSGISILLREVVREIGLDPDQVVIDLNKAEIMQAQIQQALQQSGGISGGIGAAGQSPSAGPGGAAGGGALPAPGAGAGQLAAA